MIITTFQSVSCGLFIYFIYKCKTGFHVSVVILNVLLILQEHFYDAEGNSGYIAWRLKTVQRNNRCSRTTSDDKCERRGPRTERVFSTTEKQLEGDRCQEAISFLKHCSDPEQVTAKMKSTFQFRQKMIHDPEKSSSVLSLFPRFLDTKGLVSVAHNRLLLFKIEWTIQLQHLVM